MCRYGTYFGSLSAEVSIPGLNPDTLGVYAGTNPGHNNATVVVVNKDPASPVALRLSGISSGNYFVRHFGGEAGVAKYQVCITSLNSGSNMTSDPLYPYLLGRQQCIWTPWSTLSSQHILLFFFSLSQPKPFFGF